MEKKDLLKDVIKHIDIKSYNSTQLVDAMRNMSFTSRDTARAADILMMMCKEKECTNILTLAGSTSAAGCMQVYVDMVRNKMIDVVVATGASIIDMDLFEALGFKHYIGEKENVIPDTTLRDLYIDRIYDTYIGHFATGRCRNAHLAELLPHGAGFRKVQFAPQCKIGRFFAFKQFIHDAKITFLCGLCKLVHIIIFCYKTFVYFRRTTDHTTHKNPWKEDHS